MMTGHQCANEALKLTITARAARSRCGLGRISTLGVTPLILTQNLSLLPKKVRKLRNGADVLMSLSEVSESEADTQGSTFFPYEIKMKHSWHLKDICH